MKRKVVQQGASTFMVSLPREWVKQQNVRKGQEISIEPVDDSLIITSTPILTIRKTSIDLKHLSESATRAAIVNAYRSGHDIIHITYPSEQAYAVIVDTITNYLIGFDVVKKGEAFCDVAKITEPSEEQFETIFNKIFYNISLLIDRTKERLLGKTNFEEYRQIVYKIHQYDNYCRRINAKHNLFGQKTALFWAFSTLLIHAQRELYHINQFLDKHPMKPGKTGFIDQLKECFVLLQEGYFKKDIKKLEELHVLEKKIMYMDLRTALEKQQKDNVVLFHLGFAIKNIYLASSPLMGLLMDSK